MGVGGETRLVTSLILSPFTRMHANACLAVLAQGSLYACAHVLHSQLDRQTYRQTHLPPSHLARINSNSGHIQSPVCLHFLTFSRAVTL